jgi:hypothetical protein
MVRLRQPIDIERFRPRGASRPRARRVLVLSNKLDSARRDMLESVCDDLGLELVRLGSSGTPTLAPEAELTDADIVVGYGRSVLEGMAMGRAAYVWDYAGGDGWITPETYPALEADGFCGAATEEIIDADRLRADFAAYRPELGAVSFDLVRKHHSANEHAQAILKLLAGAKQSASDGAHDTLEALGLLVRAESRAAIRAGDLEFENKQLWGRVQALEARAGAAEAAAAAEEARADGAQEQLAALLRSRSWRMTEPMRRLIGRLRRR